MQSSESEDVVLVAKISLTKQRNGVATKNGFPKVAKKKTSVDGSSTGKVYNKHHACYFCEKLQKKISKHLFMVHCDKLQVAKILLMPVSPTE